MTSRFGIHYRAIHYHSGLVYQQLGSHPTSDISFPCNGWIDWTDRSERFGWIRERSDWSCNGNGSSGRDDRCAHIFLACAH